MRHDPFAAEPGERVSAGILTELSSTAMAGVRTLRQSTCATSTAWGTTYDFRIELVHDARDPERVRQRCLTLRYGEPLQDLVVIGDMAWTWCVGDTDYAPRPFVEGMLPDPTPTLGERALVEELETEVVFLGRGLVECRDGPRELWRFSVADRRPRDEDHSTAEYVVEYDAEHRLRRTIAPPVQARGEGISELYAFDTDVSVHEPFGTPRAGDLLEP